MMPPSNVLDVGCGARRISIELSRRGYAVTGTDITTELLEVARKLSSLLTKRKAYRTPIPKSLPESPILMP